MSTLNFYGQPIVAPEHFDGEHVANPSSAGLPPVCSCGWTRWEYAPGLWFEMADHLADMNQRQGGARSLGQDLRDIAILELEERRDA